MKWLLVLLSLGVSNAPAQDAASQPQPLLRELRVDGATIFNREDILWILKVREGRSRSRRISPRSGRRKA